MSKADGTILFDTKIDEAGFEASLKNLGKLAAAGAAAAATAISALCKDAVEAYSNYEQLVGGVETLFGAGGQSLEQYAESVGKTTDQAKAEYEKLMKAQDTVIENASAAYKTAGLSANQYMETVTSFSASLLQSVGGDTIKAAKLSDQAIVDMSDNANKMGTSINSIQDAYKGFAKQQYNMLDNLKLGYGGTQQEMYRLLQDAAKLDKTFAKTAKFSIDEKGHLSASFADITQAIHIVQTEMGITGTTAKEASSTIQGSVSSMKAAWENLLTGLADENADLDVLLDNLVESAFTALENILPKVKTFLESVSTAAAEYAPSIITELVNGIVSNLNPLLEAAFAMIGALSSAITNEENLKLIVQSAVNIALKIADGLADSVDTIIDAAFIIIDTLVGALVEDDNLSSLITAAIEIIVTITTELLNHIPELIEAGLQLIVGIAQGLWDNKDEIWNAIKKIGDELIDTVRDIFSFKNVDVDMSEISQSTQKQVNGVKEAIKGVWADITGWFSTKIIQPISDFFAGLWDGIKEKAANAVNDLKSTWESVRKSVSDLWESVKNVFSEVVSWLKESIVDPIINSTFFKIVSELATGVWETIKIVWSIVSTWFNDNVVVPLTEFFTKLWDDIKALASAAWDGIVSIWNVVSNWFDDNIIVPVRDFFAELWTKISDLASEAWNKIAGVWNVVSSWFNDNIITPVKNFFADMWDGIIQKAAGAWEGIKSVFGVVADWFQSKFADAWQKVKNVFSTGGAVFSGIVDGITTAFKRVVNAIISGINHVIAIPFNAINNTLDRIRNVSIAGVHPFSGLITRFNVPQIPMLATGGVLNKATLAMLGENGAEAVVPLEKNTGWLNKIADRLNSLIANDMLNIISRLIEVFETLVNKFPDLREGAEAVRYMSGVVRDSHSSTSTAVTASGVPGVVRGGPGGGGKTEPQKPTYIENHIEVDGKETAKVITPYVEKVLDWRNK